MASTTTTAAPLKHRSVVSSFILKYPPEGGKPQVALFRRGGKVATYQHHLAPISGSIETDDPSPLSAAWRELHEETTLTDKSLELLRQGKSYSFSDPAIGRSWTVYPFVYRLKEDSPEKLTIDWEHEDWGWFDPLAVEDTAAFGGVPRLAESLRRAYFEKDLGDSPGSTGAVLAAGLDRLKNDHESGARELATTALQVLRDVVQTLEMSHDEGDQAWNTIRLASWHIWKNGRESMGAAVLGVLISALQSIENTLREHQKFPGSAHSRKWRDAVLDDLERRVALRTSPSSSVPASSALWKYIQDHHLVSSETKTLAILTLSESSTIRHFLRYLVSLPASERPDLASVEVRVLESRPLFEGVATAGSLVEHIQSSSSGGTTTLLPTKVVLYSDASAALAAADVNLVLLGADRIAATGDVSNKTGSLPAVLSARHGVESPAQVVVLGETEKIALPGNPRDHIVEDGNVEQLTEAWKNSSNTARVRAAADRLDHLAASPSLQVQVHNISFEWVSSSLIDAYVTERGVWSADDIQKYSEQLETEAKRLFDDL